MDTDLELVRHTENCMDTDLELVRHTENCMDTDFELVKLTHRELDGYRLRACKTHTQKSAWIRT